MALRTKTIEYAFELSTGIVATAVARDFTQIAALAIAETASRTIRSAKLIVSFIGAQTTAGNMTAVLMGIQLGAVARSDATVTQTIANSGENQSFIVIRDVTSYFVTNYTGSSMTADARVTVTGRSTNNATAKLIITYEYDDTSATTRTRTVRIPMDGNTASLTTSFVNLGGLANQIPALDTFLPEASKVYRDIFFEMNVHEGTTAAAASNPTLNMRYDGSTTVSDGPHEDALISDRFYRRIDKLIGAITTNAAHSIEASTSSTTMPFPALNGVLVVTYEYDHSAPTLVMQSLMIPVMSEAGWCGGTTTNDKSRFTRQISVQEPGAITLVQSGILASYIDGNIITLDFRAGAQPARTFAHPATVRCGGVSSMRRLDSGAVGGAGMTLARGFNTLTLDWFTNSATAGRLGSNMSGVLFLNYTSDKHAEGDGAHAHTTNWITKDYTATGGLVQRSQAGDIVTPTIPEANYWLVGNGYQLIIMTSGTASGNLAFAWQCEVQPGEAEGAGWRPLYSAMCASDAERGPQVSYCRAVTDFKRWPLDTDTDRLDPETPRDYRFDCNVNAAANSQAVNLVTYHSMSYTISGSISNSLGGTVNIDVHRVDTGEMIGQTSRSGDGAWSLTWYDDTVEVAARAYEAAGSFGASKEAIAGTGFDISMSAPAGGGDAATGGRMNRGFN